MCYTRGAPGDYDDWARASDDPRWAWSRVLPVFKRCEDNSRGASAMHGADGPLGVSDLRHHNVLSSAFLDAAGSAGFARTDDFNGATQEGFGLYQVTQRNGVRCSAAAAYLHPVHTRGNLRVIPRAMTTRVLLDGLHNPESPGVKCYRCEF